MCSRMTLSKQARLNLMSHCGLIKIYLYSDSLNCGPLNVPVLARSPEVRRPRVWTHVAFEHNLTPYLRQTITKMSSPSPHHHPHALLMFFFLQGAGIHMILQYKSWTSREQHTFSSGVSVPMAFCPDQVTVGSGQPNTAGSSEGSCGATKSQRQQGFPKTLAVSVWLL